MKICPKCGTSYEDETLNFCLEDGSVLNVAPGAPSEPPPTVRMSQVPVTLEKVETPVTAQQPQAAQYAPQYTMPVKKSRTWIWVLLALFAVVVVCGGGFVGLIAIGSLDPGDDQPPSLSDSSKTEKPDEEGEGRSRLTRIDLSDWPAALGSYSDIDVSYSGGDLVLNTRQNYFYVIFTKPQFTTADANVRIKVRNTRGRRTSHGYGLLVNSDPAVALKQDYAFLVDSSRRKYRVIDHVDKKETVIVDWTSSDAIKGGSSVNALEVRSVGDKMHFYINGEFVRTVTNYLADEGGVAGIYFSDDVPIAFSDFELAR